MKNVIEMQIPEPQNRGEYMGSGDASTCAGLNAYQSPQQLVQIKQAIRRGTYVEPETTFPMRFGSHNGSLVLDEFGIRTGQVVMDREKWFRHPKYPFIGCHVDGVTVHKGIPAVVEAKTTRQKWDGLPAGIFAQVQQQLACTGYELAFVPVMRFGSEPEIFEVEADPMYQDFLCEKVADIWQHVLNETLPPPMTLDDLKDRYPADEVENIMATQETHEIAEKLYWIKDAIAKAKDQQAVLEMAIKGEMQEAATLISEDGEILATWKSSKPRATFNSKKLKAECPEIYEQFLEIGKPARTFRLKVNP
jgi:predicted phage-related endonuclease